MSYLECGRCGDSGFDRNACIDPEIPEGHWAEHTWLCVDCDWATHQRGINWERIIWDKVTGVKVSA
jgi:hypothetical protein